MNSKKLVAVGTAIAAVAGAVAMFMPPGPTATMLAMLATGLGGWLQLSKPGDK